MKISIVIVSIHDRMPGHVYRTLVVTDNHKDHVFYALEYEADEAEIQRVFTIRYEGPYYISTWLEDYKYGNCGAYPINTCALDHNDVIEKLTLLSVAIKKLLTHATLHLETINSVGVIDRPDDMVSVMVLTRDQWRAPVEHKKVVVHHDNYSTVYYMWRIVVHKSTPRNHIVAGGRGRYLIGYDGKITYHDLNGTIVAGAAINGDMSVAMICSGYGSIISDLRRVTINDHVMHITVKIGDGKIIIHDADGAQIASIVPDNDISTAENRYSLSASDADNRIPALEKQIAELTLANDKLKSTLSRIGEQLSDLV